MRYHVRSPSSLPASSHAALSVVPRRSAPPRICLSAGQNRPGVPWHRHAPLLDASILAIAAFNCDPLQPTSVKATTPLPFRSDSTAAVQRIDQQPPPASLWNQAVNVLYRTRQGLRRGKAPRRQYELVKR